METMRDLRSKPLSLIRCGLTVAAGKEAAVIETGETYSDIIKERDQVVVLKLLWMFLY